MNNSKKILFAPLDWGLGHATRCIPLIKECLELGHQVLIAGNENTNALLKESFPELTYFFLKGYNIKYSAHKFLLPFSIISQIPKLVASITSEQKWLQEFIKSHQIDCVISDNRYGLYSTIIPSYFITHQLQIQVPQSSWLQQKLNTLNRFYIKKFTACWVPDYKDEAIAGQLSRCTQLQNIHYLGNLSRFETSAQRTFQYDILILLSGPEPQRSILEEQILQELSHLQVSYLLVRGLPLDKNKQTGLGTINAVNHLHAEELQIAIQSSKLVLCRSGYSTIMDLIKLRKHAVLIPTPGQTEQEYLGHYLASKNWFIHYSQHQLSLIEIIDTYQQHEFTNFPNWNFELYKQPINKFFND